MSGERPELEHDERFRKPDSEGGDASPDEHREVTEDHTDDRPEFGHEKRFGGDANGDPDQAS